MIIVVAAVVHVTMHAALNTKADISITVGLTVVVVKFQGSILLLNWLSNGKGRGYNRCDSLGRFDTTMSSLKSCPFLQDLSMDVLPAGTLRSQYQ